MAQPSRYMFDNRFDLPAIEQKEQVKQFVERELGPEFELKLKETRNQAYEQGFREGEQKALDQAEARIATTLNHIVESSAAVSHEIERQIIKIREDAFALAVTAAEKLSSGLVSSDPNAPVERLLQETFCQLRGEPQITIRISEGLVDDIDLRASLFAAQYGLSDKLHFVGDPELPPGDFDIEWSVGGIRHRFREIEQKILDFIEQYLEKFIRPPSDPALFPTAGQDEQGDGLRSISDQNLDAESLSGQGDIPINNFEQRFNKPGEAS